MAKTAKKRFLKDYLSTLPAIERCRYEGKLNSDSVSFPDPYSIPDSDWKSDVTLWPDVGYGDIWNYLVLTPGVYTAETMKAYKSLDGYNFFVSGKVMPIVYYSQDDAGTCILMSTVQPSQTSLNDKKMWHHPWVMVDKKCGSIVSAHCTCKAG